MEPCNGFRNGGIAVGLHGLRRWGRLLSGLGCLALAQAASAAGPQAPGGADGGSGLGIARPARPDLPQRPARPAAGGEGSGNRIEVSGNTASGVRCSQDGSVSVNSVDVNGASLQGRTVIVQGRNVNNVSTADCAAQPAAGAAPSGQVNGVRIR
ncbi:MAG: hypothetical protein ACN6O3_07730 [Comamonas sp.]